MPHLTPIVLFTCLFSAHLRIVYFNANLVANVSYKLSIYSWVAFKVFMSLSIHLIKCTSSRIALLSPFRLWCELSRTGFWGCCKSRKWQCDLKSCCHFIVCKSFPCQWRVLRLKKDGRLHPGNCSP